MRRIVLSALVAFGILFVQAARADVKLPSIIGDNMVLQADQALPIWGWAAPGEAVTVSLGDQKKSATADADGRWMVKLDAVKTGGPVEMTVAGKNTITVRNILIGQVWICSGQSNMGFTLNRAHNASEVIPKAANPKIRLFQVKLTTAADPQADCVGKWEECTPETVKNFTAVGYFFGRDIQKALDVPVGLVNTSWGGTPAQAWTSMAGLKSEPSLDVFIDSYKKTFSDLEAQRETYQKQTLPRFREQQAEWSRTVGREYRAAMEKWRKEAPDARAAGRPEPAQPRPARNAPRRPEEPGRNPHTPTVLYNAMIHPLVPFAIKGAIWYQGESNAGNPMQYRVLFPAMIKDWRRAWGEGDFPFIWVQLANYMKRDAEPTQGAGGWAGLREAQNMTLSLPNTGQAVIIDIGEGNDIHPKNKDAVGARLALAAWKIAYHRNGVYSGPTFASMTVEGNQARIRFDNVGGGLVIGARPGIRLEETAPKPLDHLVGFAIAGEDHKFVWADARIDGDSVIVHAEGVSKPVAVRYGWANNPEVNLYNKEGLPASPFRTDDWK